MLTIESLAMLGSSNMGSKLNPTVCAAVIVLQKSFNRTALEYLEFSKSKIETRAAQGGALFDSLAELFFLIKTDQSIFEFSNATDLKRLYEAYVTNPAYGYLVKAKTFELTAIIGAHEMLEAALKITEGIHGANKSQMHANQYEDVDLRETFSKNPWLITLILSSMVVLETE